MGSRLPFPQYQQSRRAKNKNEEEQLVTNDGAENSHFPLAGREPLRLAQFVQTRQRQLKCHEDQDNARRGKKSVQGNAQCAFKEEQPHRDGRANSRKRADPGL